MKAPFPKLLISLSILFCISLAPFSLLAQKKNPDIVSMDVLIKTHVNTANPKDTLDPTYDVTYKLVLSDTLDLKKIHLNADTLAGGKGKFDLHVKFDDKNNLPPGLIYQRTGKVVLLTLTSQHLYTDYYYQAKTENGSGVLSPAHTYHYK